MRRLLSVFPFIEARTITKAWQPSKWLQQHLHNNRYNPCHPMSKSVQVTVIRPHTGHNRWLSSGRTQVTTGDCHQAAHRSQQVTIIRPHRLQQVTVIRLHTGHNRWLSSGHTQVTWTATILPTLELVNHNLTLFRLAAWQQNIWRRGSRCATTSGISSGRWSVPCWQGSFSAAWMTSCAKLLWREPEFPFE